MSPVFVTPGRSASPILGVQRILTVPNPAAGEDWVLTFPGGAWWRILTGNFILTASAAVANRAVNIDYLDGATRFAAVAAQVVQTAGQTRIIGVSTQGPQGGAAGILTTNLLLPDLVLPAGYVVRSRTDNLDGADQFSQIRLLVEEIDLGPYGAALESIELGVESPETPEG